MIEPKALLADLQRLLGRLVVDLRERATELPDLDAKLRAEHAAARAAQRTAETFEEWREEALTQAAVHWILGCVFVRFLEDNHFVERPFLSGPGARRDLARDRHTLYFQSHPSETDREYLYAVFHEVAALPGAVGLYDERHNPIGWLGLSGDGATALLDFWGERDPDTGDLACDFTDPTGSTRFLGDLYQDLSESARKRFALLQTPEFVEEFILDRTLTPAIEDFGYREVRLLDPTCGSGHFLLGAFHRLLALHLRHEPGTNSRELAQRALDQVAGVDVNPFATAIARFRLWIAALRASDVTRLSDAPAFRVNVATGDSLLHGPRFMREAKHTGSLIRGAQLGLEELGRDAPDSILHVYLVEDRDELARILGRQYHAVVGNPPYITVKDKALNQAYRDKYESCHMKYSLAVPFMERFWELAIPSTDTAPAGHVGMITANSFMKREFGKKLIQEFIPKWDLTHVVDTSGAYIPAHGTPTVILFGRNRAPVGDTVRAVMGIRGEPTTPDDPAEGLVWRAILTQLDQPGSESEFVSVADAARESFHRHPWSLGGGGAAELKEAFDERVTSSLGDVVASVGITSFTLEDDVFLQPADALRRRTVEAEYCRPMVVGDAIRDWVVAAVDLAVFPYDSDLRPIPLDQSAGWYRHLWLARTNLSNNKMFGGQTKVDAGLKWYEFGRLTADKLRTPLSITFAFVATHNHFVLDRGGKVFKQTAPVIKLPPDATEDDHLALLGLLNSSTACFWMKQVMSCKGLGGQGGGIKPEDWHRAYEFDSTKLGSFPIPSNARRLVEITRRIDHHVRAERSHSPASVLRMGTDQLGARLTVARENADRSKARLVALQEDLDWLTYDVFGIAPYEPASDGDLNVGIHPTQRPVEFLVQESISKGEPTIFYDVHRSRGVGGVRQLSDAMSKLIQRRLEAIERTRDLQILETLNYKRRWQATSRVDEEAAALRQWLLDRLEDPRYWPAETLTSCARLAERVRQDADFMKVAEVFRGTQDFDVVALVTELVEEEGVPFLPVLRYRESGLRKRAQWERTWDLQRQEDAIDARGLPEDEAKEAKRREVGEIDVPPKYTSADFARSSHWRLRGKLDVPKERFILYPHAERAGDATAVLGWAGWDHLQQAKALATHYVEMKEQEGWTAERLAPLLAGLLELEPWLLQWHNQLDPSYGVGMGDYYRDFAAEELRALGLTRADARAWTPPARARGAGRKGKGRR